jgi:hypothetical protein
MILVTILPNLYKLYFTNEAPERFGNWKAEGEVIWALKYADDL